MVREEMDVYERLVRLLYLDSETPRFVKTESTNKLVLNPANMAPIKEYIAIKRLICDSSPPAMSGLVEFSLLKKLCQQVHCRAKSVMV